MQQFSENSFESYPHSKQMGQAHPNRLLVYYRSQSTYLNADTLISIDDDTTIAKFNPGITLKFISSRKW
jgi:hypothetical protein